MYDGVEKPPPPSLEGIAPVVSGSRRAHRRGRSEPLTPAHRLALATESARLSEGKTVCVAEEVVEPLPFRRVPSLPTFLAYEKWRPQPEWTTRAAKLLAVALLVLVVFAWAAMPAEHPRVAASLHEPVLLHQTVPSLRLTPREQAWRESWQRLGFKLQTADDADCRTDIQRLAEETGQPDYLQVYDALETGVQKADMWRYSALYLYGGVYADVDVVAKPQMVELLNTYPNRSGIVFVESLPSPWLIGFFARFLYVTDMVRVPQYRNCIMIARRGWGAMRLTLDNIVAKFKDPPPRRAAEPTFTLELTGPGIFTDSVKACDSAAAQAQASLAISAVGRPGGERVGRRGTRGPRRAAAQAAAQDEGSLIHISRLAGNRYFEHVGQGSWKNWRQTVADSASGRALRRGLDPHEVRLVLVLVLAMLAAGFALLLTRSAAARLALAQAHGSAQRAARQLGLRERGAAIARWLAKRAVQWAAVLVSVSGLRSLCGARWLNPWRVVGFWLCLFEGGLRRPPPAVAPVLSQHVSQESLSVVVCCGQTIGARLSSNRLIDAIEEFGSHFRSYSVHLAAGHLRARDARDNTRQVLRAWTIRNPRVTLHAEANGDLEASRQPGGQAGDAARNVTVGSLPGFVRRFLPPRVGYVLVIDGELPSAFHPEALLTPFSWALRWDAICANTMDADGELLLASAASQNSSPFAPGALSAWRTATWTWTRHGAGAALPARVPLHGAAVAVSSCAQGMALYRRAALEACAASGEGGTPQQPLPRGFRANASSGEPASPQAAAARDFVAAAPAAAGKGAASTAGAAATLGDSELAGAAGGGTCERHSLHRCMASRGFGRLFILPSLAMRHSSLTLDAQYVLLTLLLLLPAITPCVVFCVRCLGWWHQRPALGGDGAAGWSRLASRLCASAGTATPRGRLVFVALLLIVCAQLGVVWQLHAATSTAASSPLGAGHELADAGALARTAAAGGEPAGGGPTSGGIAGDGNAGGGNAGGGLAGGGGGGGSGVAAAWRSPRLVDSPAVLLVPLLLPGITAVDLVVDQRAGRSLGERVSTAALTVLTPLFWLLELRRLQGGNVAVAASPHGSPASAAADDARVPSDWEQWAAPCEGVEPDEPW